MSHARAVIIWIAVVSAVIVPLVAAAVSPLLAWRDWVYIVAGFAGILAMTLLLLQPLLIGGSLPGLSTRSSRKYHRVAGSLLVTAVVIHVVGLWITSPPDVVDALLLVSPTPFSLWGVIAMWAVFLTALLAVVKKPLRLRPATWRLFHAILVVLFVGGTIAHAFLIEGAMEVVTKIVLGVLIFAASSKVLIELRPWALLRARFKSG